VNVSVIIPTRGSSFLGDALRCVTMQTRAPQEVIVVEDGCAAASSECAPRPRVVSLLQRHGAAAARNAGVRAAMNEWVAFLDDDDRWLPGYLARACEAAADADVVCTAFLSELGGVVAPEKDAPHMLQAADFFGRNPGLRASNLLIRRELFLRIGGFDESLPALHDIDLGLRLAREGVRYARVADRLVVHRKHDGERISAAGSAELEVAVPRFLAIHGASMTAEDKRAYRQRALRYFGTGPAGEPRE
jgi:glycosyltransferase involved in cell wall biosynthesis